MCFACDPGDTGLTAANPSTAVSEYGRRFVPQLAIRQRANLVRAQALLCASHYRNYVLVVEALEAEALAIRSQEVNKHE